MQAWYAGPTQTNFQKLIETGPKLKDLFEDSDFFTELKAYNPKLLEYISNTPNLIGQAIEYITITPSDSDSQARKHKYPMLSVEMIQTETVSILSSFYKPITASESASSGALRLINTLPKDLANPIYLDLLFTFPDQQHPLLLLTGYFVRVCNTLLNAKYKQTAEYFYSRPAHFKKLLKHIENANMSLSIMIFLNVESAKLGKPYEQWRPKRLECVNLLIEALGQNANKQDGMAIQNITNILADITEKYYLIADGKELMDLVLTQKSITQLFSIIENNNPMVAIPVISLMVSLVNYYSFCSLNTDDKQSPELTQKNRQRLEAQPLIMQISNKFEHLCQKLPALSYITLTDFKILELLCHCISLSSPNLFKAVKKSNFFVILLDLFFKFEQSNILHNLILKLFIMIFKNQRSIYEQYKQHLFVEVDIINRTISVLNGQQLKILQTKGYFGHLIQITKVYSEIQTMNENIINMIRKYTEMWKQLVMQTLKPYDQVLRKDLGSYDIKDAPKPIEYKIRETSYMVPAQKSPIGEKIAEQSILEQAKFMKSHSQQQSPADALQSGNQKPHIIESDTFFKLPIQQVLEQANKAQQHQTASPQIATSSLTPKLPQKSASESFKEFLQQKKIEAGETIKIQRSVSQERRLTPSRGPKMASPSPRKKNSWTESEDTKQTEHKQPAAKFFKKQDQKPPVASIPHLPVAKKQLASSTILNNTCTSPTIGRSLTSSSTDPLAKSMDSILNIKHIKIKMSTNKAPEVKKCRPIQEKDMLLLNFLGIKVSK